jgi:hypothetical protein
MFVKINNFFESEKGEFTVFQRILAAGNEFFAWQPVALVGFSPYTHPAGSGRKTFDKRAALAVCRVKNRLIGDFFGFKARSATN